MLKLSQRTTLHVPPNVSRRGLCWLLPWQPMNRRRRCHSSGPSQELPSAVIPPPRHARVVICGGGIAGLSTAYHLSRMGWTDVVVVEQGRLASGTTWHSSGMLGVLRKTHFNTLLSQMSYNLYKQSSEEAGLQTGLQQCGSVFIAQTKDFMIDLRKRHANAKGWGVHTELLSIGDIHKLLPWIRVDDLEGGMLVKEDAFVESKDATITLAAVAKSRGVTIVEKVGVDRILTKDGRVSSVQTDNGEIDCEFFVNCAGMWARDLGLLSSPAVKVPLHPVARQYLVTKPMDSLTIDPSGPYIRDPDSLLYIRGCRDGLLFGGYSPKGKPVFFDEPIPRKQAAEYIQLPDDWDHFRHLLEGFLHRVPLAADVQFENLFNGPESFTADGEFIMGEAPEVDNYFVLAGFCAGGLSFAGGAGQLLAELIVDGHASVDYWPADIKRFSPHQNSKAFLRNRVTEMESYNYRINYPGYSYRSGRKLRCPPLYSRLAQAGAVFDERLGVERPNWFMSPEDTDEFVRDTQQGTFSKPHWFNFVKDEYWACRESVCAMDMSTFTKFELRSTGDETTMLLQRLCPNDLDCPIGSVVHTGMLNERGGYENDCSIARLDSNRYFIISPTNQLVKGHHWISRHLPSDGSVVLHDLTNRYSGLNILGPNARDVLKKLTTAPVDSTNLRPFTCKEMDIAFATGVKVMTVTHAGEDGMVLYIPNEVTTQVYDAVMEAGEDYGIRNAGYYALRWLRIEKFYFYWGEDFDAMTTPFEIGREMRVNFEKGVDFIGKSALLKQRDEGIRRRLAGFILDDHNITTDLWPWGREPIYRDGQLVGMTTCSSYGPAQGKMICLGWLTARDPTTGSLTDVSQDFLHKGHYEIDIAGKRFPAKARLYPYQLGTKQPTHG